MAWLKHSAEWILAGLGFVILFLALALFAPGGPISTDITWYMNAGLNGIKDTFILNRYFHVFFEAIFLKLSPSPLAGLQTYWAFLIAGTCLLIYLSARHISTRSRPLHGLLAVLLFLSISAISETCGMALVDTTAMFMVMLLVTTYIASSRIHHRSKWLIGLFGLLFLLAFKTKETTLAAGVLVIGFGFDDSNSFNWKVFFRTLIYLAAGAVVGMLLVAILSWIFLGDPFFGLRPAELRAFLQTYIQGTSSAEKLPGTDDWFTGYFLKSLWLPFLLYLISGVKATLEPEFGSEFRFVWLVPLAGILFVTVTVGNQWGFLPRFVFPTLPVICLLGPQYLRLNTDPNGTRKDQFTGLAILAAGLLLMVLIRFGLRAFLTQMGLDANIFYTGVYMPVLWAIVLALTFFWKKISLNQSMVLCVLILSILAIPLVKNGRTMLLNHPNQVLSQHIFYPFSAFSDSLDQPDIHMYVSGDAWNAMEVGYIAKDVNEIASLYNIYFDSKTTASNFKVSAGPLFIASDLASTDYAIVLLSMADWQSVIQDPNTRALLEQKYTAAFDPQRLIVLLTPQDPAPES